ncbi:dihydrodipicolinate synthase family protein [Klebsiella variicola subsp. variicola]|nr:dihydrodipicolinate synthase family protein [Klebsiella variicola subsp. variicola]
MTFHIPPALRIYGQFTVGVSETVVVTETGYRQLGSLARLSHCCKERKMKDINECRERLRGISTSPSPRSPPAALIDFPALRENIERVIGLGYDGLLIGGTYGEFPVMTVEERRELFHQVAGLCG